jgi:DNA-binding MurR/RpiR family transcriptional regulator
MPKQSTRQSIRDRMINQMPQLTATERRIANVILADFPYGGLVTIQELAERSRSSAPSITRFVAKIGCGGYQDFQRQLIGALRKRELSPIELKLTEAPSKGTDFLADYTHRVARLMRLMSENLPAQTFNEVCDLIADPSRNIFMIGGRVTDSIAQILAIHLRQIRGRIYHLPADPEQWPEYVLRMRKQDVLILFDVRRYDPRLAELAAIVSRKRGSAVVSVTDKWLSPTSQYASHIFPVPTDLETPWDTSICLVTLAEAIIVRVSEMDWPATRKRISNWDAIRFALSARGGVDPETEVSSTDRYD